MSDRDYRLRQAEEKIRISRDLINGDGDRDILNLEYMIQSIDRNSIMWNMGCIKTLRKAIKLFEKEKRA